MQRPGQHILVRAVDRNSRSESPRRKAERGPCGYDTSRGNSAERRKGAAAAEARREQTEFVGSRVPCQRRIAAAYWVFKLHNGAARRPVRVDEATADSVMDAAPRHEKPLARRRVCHRRSRLVPGA